MKKEKTFNIKLTVTELETLLKAIEETAYYGKVSENVSILKDKLKPENYNAPKST